MMTKIFRQIIINFDSLSPVEDVINGDYTERLYKNKDYSEESVKQLYLNFEKNMIEKYILESQDRCYKVPIIENKSL